MGDAEQVKRDQILLCMVQPDLAVDGIWGPRCAAVLAVCPKELKRELEGSYETEQGGVTTGANETMSKQITLSTTILNALRVASAESNVPFQWLAAIAFIESRFNPLAVNGSSRGLFQIQESAWLEAGARVKLKPYGDHWFIASENARAGASYMRLLAERLRNDGIDAWGEPRYMYMAHQQGAGGAANIIRAARGLPHGFINPANLWANPAPRTMPTRDPVTWYNNWMSYMGGLFKGRN